MVVTNEKANQLVADKNLAIAIKRLNALQRANCFDPYNFDSRPTVTQKQALDDITHYKHRYCLGGNQSGKSQTASRECAWIFSNSHPTFERPTTWGNMPLTMVIVGRTSTQTEELWSKKVAPFLDAQEYKEVRIGGSLQKIIHRINGNTILLFSHHSPEEAREKVQSFTVHWLWLDEMPNSFKLLEELHRRCQAYGGRFLATFTPKLRNNDIRKMIDTPSPYQRTYKFGMMDNPIYKGREAEVLAPLESLPESYRNTLLMGDWYIGDTAVYSFDSRDNCRELPANYAPSWRHIEAIDPAASSKAGYVILAEDPKTHIWHITIADYITGASAKVLLAEMAVKRNHVNIVKRISDPHESWFIKHAQEEGMNFQGVWKKTERKKELIKGLQDALDTQKIVLSPWLNDLINEFATCQWSETAEEKIVGARRFHILDALQYAVDNIPEPLPVETATTYNQWLRQANQVRIKAEKDQKANVTNLPGRIIARRGRMIRRA